ncbi:MAG: hypothetical protein FJ295_11900 [Planctomycetes bacterium]|nr:hypothetical protein [Planctomycetota bacterium]
MQFRAGSPTIVFRMTGWFRSLYLAGIALACVGGEGLPLAATEPWIDRRLPVSEGLELWLDASTIPAAAAANGHVVPPPNPGSRLAPPIAVWHDGSG